MFIVILQYIIQLNFTDTEIISFDVDRLGTQGTPLTVPHFLREEKGEKSLRITIFRVNNAWIMQIYTFYKKII